MDSKLLVFQDKEIRRTLHNGEWWFVVEDVVLALIDSNDPKQYIKRMRSVIPNWRKGGYKLYLPFRSKHQAVYNECHAPTPRASSA